MASKTWVFQWEGSDRKGKRVKGELRAASLALAKAELRRQGIVPTRIRKKAQPLFGGGKKKGKVTAKDVALFTRQLATMVGAGVPLVAAFDIMARGSDNPALADLLQTIKTDVESGRSLSQALRRHPRLFDDLYCSIVQAGEQAGILETLLDKLATYKEKTEALKGKIKKALFYPTAILIVAFVITTVLLLYVIPQFESLFESFGGDLPAPTRFVLELSAAFQAYWPYIFGALGLGGWAAMNAKRKSKAFNAWLDRTLLKLPVLGEIVRKATIARFARTLSTMLAAGVPLVEALEAVADAAGNSVYAEAIRKIREEVATGRTLNMAMQQSGVFPNMVTQMVSIGEEAGKLDAMLGKVAEFYEEEVDDAVAGLSTLIEPVIMAVLGILIGGLVIAMYLPIFKMGQVV